VVHYGSKEEVKITVDAGKSKAKFNLINQLSIASEMH
jgi:hypothetical protein